MFLSERYRPRTVSPLGLESLDGWRLKVYGISYEAQVPPPELIDAAMLVAAERLPQPAETESRYGVGFLIVHDGRSSNFVCVDWWGQENELHHHVYFSEPASPDDLRSGSDGDPIACAWDLSVVSHEREAWVRHVLANTAGPDLDAYLADTLSGQL